MANFSALKTAIQNAIKQNGNEEITGDVLQQILLSIVSSMGDGAINTIEQNLSNETLARQGADNTLQSHIDEEALARGNADTQLQNAINAIKANIDNGYVYAGIATPSSTPVSGKVFYIATAAGTYTDFGGQVLTQGINILRFNGSAWSSQQLIGIDDAPTAGGNSLVKSGGVQNELALGAVYDVSAKNPTAGPNNDGKWESLSALLSDANLNTLIPTAYRKGGMSIKFVHTNDNKYVQARLMANSFTTDITKWQGVDEEPTAGSQNLITSGGVAAIVDGKITEKPSIWSTGNDVLCRMATAQYISMNGFTARLVPINGGESVFAKGNSNGSGIAVVKTFSESSSWTAYDFATGEDAVHSVPASNSTTFICPSDAKYLIIAKQKSGTDQIPAEMTIDGVDVFNPLPSELSILNTKVANLEDAVYPEKVTWCGDNEMNDVIEELYIPNASTVLGNGSYINVLAVGTGSVSFIVKDSGGNEIVRMNKAFCGSIDKNPDGSYNYYFGRKGKAAISTIYKKNSNNSLLQRIGYIKLKDITFAKTSTGAATLNLTNISNIENSPIIKKMVNDGRQVILSGDSHFGAFKGVNILQDLLQGELGVQVYNIGFGGCRMAWREAAGANGYDAYTFCDVVDAVIDSSFTKQEANVDLSNDYPPSVANLEAIDTTKPMLFLVEYCVNDHWGNSPIGDVYEDDGTFNVSDDTEVATKLASFDRTTFLGALNYGLLKLYANKPKSLWVQVTGGARVIDNPDSQGRRMRYNRQNTLGKTLDDYNKALADDCSNIGIRYADYPNNGLYNAFAMREGDEGITTGGSIHNNALGFCYMSKAMADMARYYLGLN